MLDVKTLRENYQNGKTVQEQLDIIYANIEKDNQRTDKINSFNSLTKDLAYKQVKESKKGPLEGIFVAVKDNIHVKGEKTTCSSKILENYEAIYDATVVENLKNAGAIIVGKANLDEFAMGATNTMSYFGDVRNPHNREHVAGGSSGGSAASVAAGFTSMALGSDTGGSIRVPAAYCGIVGLKPTYGAISRYGVMAMSAILDQIGPMASNVEDCALLYSVLASKDNRDSNSVEMPKINFDTIANPQGKKKIGYVKEFESDVIHSDVKKRFHDVLEQLRLMGHEVVEISLPHIEHSIETYFIISRVQAFSGMSMIDGIRYGHRVPAEKLIDIYKESRGEGLHPEVIKRLLIGNYILSKTEYYPKARQVQTLLNNELQDVYKDIDLIISPSCPYTAPKLDSSNFSSVEGFLVDMITSISNLTGTPAISIPAGKDSHGMPIGVQIMGNLQSEQEIFELSMQIQNLGL